jgi:serine carboxypeptidase-like clade 2
MSMRAVVIAAAVLAAVASAGEILSMPGLNTPMPSKMYSGHITVDEADDRRLFYMHVESTKSPATDPLIIWLTGGPGCSSITAAFEENGPFKMNFTAGGNGIYENPFSWSNVGNMVYLESPAGVGFSISNNTADYTTGDYQTREDTYAFLQGFLREFPQYKGRKFWITGESYGGHYVPELAYTIQQHNKALLPAEQAINLQGWMVGNPWTDPEREAFGVTDNWWQRAIISDETHENINTFCEYQDITFWIINNVSAGVHSAARSQGGWWDRAMAKAQAEGKFVSAKSLKCFAALKQACMVEFSGIDILGVYLDQCNKGTNGGIVDQPNYCANSQLTTYMNRADVQKAMHVGTPMTWAGCSSEVNYNGNDTVRSVLYIYEEAIAKTDLKILVYSGDNDAIVPYTGTRRWLRALNRPIVNPLHQWYSNSNGPQVGGWAVQYDRLTFTTVRAAGHLVPYMQPERALHLIKTFMRDGTI